MEARLFRPALGMAIALYCCALAPAQLVLPANPPTGPIIPVMVGAAGMQAGPQPFIKSGSHPEVLRSVAQPVGSRVGQHPRGASVAQSENFIVFASNPQWASQVAEAAEAQRRDLAIYWLGRELPAWSQRCPLHVQDGEQLGAGGETRFALVRGVPGQWLMSVQGTRERILDSVLPHEITHTIFATHFGRMNKYVPRWADEGAATTVEHEAEKKKHRHFLHQFLKTGRGLAFNEMFRLKEYPDDILPLYAQGHSAVQFLLDQAGPRQFIQFLEKGMQTDNWPAALTDHYVYQSIGDFQLTWNQWLKDGSPTDLLAYSPLLRKQNESSVMLASHETPGNPTNDLALVANGANQNLPVPQVSPAKPNVGMVAFASNVQPSKAELSNAQQTSDSWYKRKLYSTSGSSATPIPPHNHYAGDPGRNASGPSGLDFSSVAQPQGPAFATASSRPGAPQTPGIQVLEWGNLNGRN